MFDTWCNVDTDVDERKTLWRIAERENGRDAVLQELIRRVRDHYASNEEIVSYLEQLGYEVTAAVVCELYPQTTTGQSGDLGEILASELIEEWLGDAVPVRKLRQKDHRDMAMRGEDIIGVDHDDRGRLKLLKGESKSAQALGTNTVVQARASLEANHGRPSAHSMIFLGRRLVESEEENERSLGFKILDEATKQTIPMQRIAHLLFALTENLAGAMLDDDFEAADERREQHIAHLRIHDHANFVKLIFEQAVDHAID